MLFPLFCLLTFYYLNGFRIVYLNTKSVSNTMIQRDIPINMKMYALMFGIISVVYTLWFNTKRALKRVYTFITAVISALTNLLSVNKDFTVTQIGSKTYDVDIRINGFTHKIILEQTEPNILLCLDEDNNDCTNDIQPYFNYDILHVYPDIVGKQKIHVFKSDSSDKQFSLLEDIIL